VTALLALLLACTGAPGDTAAPAGADTAGDSGAVAVAPLRVVTFNSGTTAGVLEDGVDNDGYGPEQAAISDTWYGDGLAWTPAIDAAAAWFAKVQPDVVVFQEIFWTGDCAAIPEEARAGFVCEGWQEGDPTVVQRVLGDGYQIACHPGKPDKCAAIRSDVGQVSGCDADFCLEGLVGTAVEGCGSGARVARGEVTATSGVDFTLVSFHGSSGVDDESEACRVAQVGQVFDDLGDGAPGASGARNLVMGDLNTDPYRFASFDDSAALWLEHTADGQPFSFITEVGPDAPGSYQGVADIDHVVSDAWQGSCWYAGLSEGHPAVYAARYFDHQPVVCDVSLR